MDVMQTMTFCVFMGQELHNPFLGIFIFIMEVSPSNFVVVSLLLTSLRNSYVNDPDATDF